MKRLYWPLAAALAVLCTALPAHADSYLDNAVSALKHSSVYVAPGTEGTDSNTADDLQQNYLTSNDNIVLVGDLGIAGGFRGQVQYLIRFR